MSRSLADGTCSFRPDESVCATDLKETDFGEVLLSSSDDMPQIEEEEERPKEMSKQEDHVRVNEFIRDRVDTFSRNVDFCQGVALGWTRSIGAMLNQN
jgi:hypothetical protein